MVPAFLFLIGGMMVAMGVLIRRGVVRAWFARNASPYYSMPSSGLTVTPIGLGIILVSVLLTEKALDILGEDLSLNTMTCAIWSSIFLGLVLGIWRPGWALPDWYRWLKENHGEILPLLREKAQEMAPRAWQARVRTQEGLEQWVEEVRQRHQKGT